MQDWFWPHIPVALCSESQHSVGHACLELPDRLCSCLSGVAAAAAAAGLCGSVVRVKHCFCIHHGCRGWGGVFPALQEDGEVVHSFAQVAA